MSRESPQAVFWNGIARRYAAIPMRSPENWEKTLALTAARLSPGDRVLEIGCGTGSTALRLAEHVAEYVGTDDASAMIGIARERLRETPVAQLSFETGRPGDGSLPEGPFDVVTGFNILHLLPDPAGALAELRGRLRPGGLLITKTPCLGGNRYAALWPLVRAMRLVGKAPPLRFLSPARLEAAIEGAGFEILERGDYPAMPPSRFVVARAPG
ncbi:MAG: class I SAM-dependent methyltransferase [Roseicyclus sp.]